MYGACVYSRLSASMGGFALAGHDVDGGAVTNEFLLYHRP